MENNEKIKVESAGIDKDVLDIMTQEDVLKAISDETQMKRFELNFFCELLSEIKGLRKDFDEFSQMISVCSAEVGRFLQRVARKCWTREKKNGIARKNGSKSQKIKKVNKKWKKVSKRCKIT